MAHNIIYVDAVSSYSLYVLDISCRKDYVLVFLCCYNKSFLCFQVCKNLLHFFCLCISKCKAINNYKFIVLNFGSQSGFKSFSSFFFVRQLANKRQGTQKAKTRSEVSGGGRKPWRQKGTGHARQGSIRAAQWTGGGIIFAPTPRDYEVKMNKKERREALKSALTSKVQDNKLVVVDALTLADVKTKEMQKVLTNLKAEKALVITATDDKNVILSARNITDVQTATPSTINVYDVMNHNTVIVTKDAVASIEEVYA